MRVSVLRSGFTIFIIFFGVSVLDALRSGDASRIAFWLAIALTFYALDRRREGENA